MSNVWDDHYNKRALEEIAREDAIAIMEKPKWQDICEKTAGFLAKMGVPLFYCAVLGEMQGGNAQSLVNSWSIGVLPSMLALACIKVTKEQATPKYLEEIVDDKREEYEQLVRQSEKPQYLLALAALGTPIAAGLYALCSAVTASISEMNISSRDMGLVGACVGLTFVATQTFYATETHQRILKRGDRLRFEDMLDA